MILFFVFSSY